MQASVLMEQPDGSRLDVILQISLFGTFDVRRDFQEIQDAVRMATFSRLSCWRTYVVELSILVTAPREIQNADAQLILNAVCRATNGIIPRPGVSVRVRA